MDMLDINYLREDKVMKTLRRMCKSMFSVMEVQKIQEKSPTSVSMVLGLARQNKPAVFQFLLVFLEGPNWIWKSCCCCSNKGHVPQEDG